MFREIIQTLACLSVLNGSTLSLHLNNDRTGTEHSSSSGIGIGGGPSMASSGTLQHHSNNPYRRMAAAAESDRERMMFMGVGGGGGSGGHRSRPIITGRMHLTTGDLIDGGAVGVKNYQPSSLTMLQDNEFPIRREPFFFAGDDDGDGDRGGGGGGVFEEFQNPTQPDHYHRYDDGSLEIMEDIFNRGEGIYRKFPPIHHQSSSGSQFQPQSPRGLQELFDHHDSGTATDEVATSHRRDFRSQQKMQRKRTQQKKNQQEKLPSSGSKPSASSTSSLSSSSSAAGAVIALAPSSTNSQEQQQNTNQPQQQLLHPNSNNKRSGITSGIGSPPPVTHSIASQLMLRTARGQRQYDVPQIECPSAIDGMERFACPTPDLQGRYRCIDDHVLCDGFIDCPEGEDEDRRSCMFYKTTKAHLDVLADALLRWARGR